MQPELTGISDYYKIGPHLATAGQPSEGELHVIKAAGFDAVINLALPTSDNALPNESSVVTGLGMIFAHIPVDFKNPTESDFRAFCGIMDALKERRVFVHCAANKRVSAFVFLYRVIRQRFEIAEAERDLKAVWEPDEVWGRFIREQLTANAVRREG